MRTRLRPSRRSRALERAVSLAVVAAVAGGFVVADPVEGARDSAARVAASAWNAVFGARPATTHGRRMIVVLRAPSLADRMAQAEAPPTSEDQKRWVAEADAAQRLLLSRLASRGLAVKRERTFTRTLNGFSADLDARAQAELERSNGVAGVYPVRTVYPAALTAETLALPEFRPGAGRRPDVGLPGFDGAGHRIALLDSGVALDHPFLGGRVARGLDLVDGDRRAAAEPKPDDPSRVESHGTRMAGILVGGGGPAGLGGIAAGARVFPIRILGWERAGDGSYSLMGAGDTLLAGFERAVDPDGDGDVEDVSDVTLAAVVEPYSSFSDSPESRAVEGATRLGTLVVASAGNDGRAGRGFGTVGAPGGAAAALTVGAIDARREVLDARTIVRVGDDELIDARTAALGALRPDGELPVAALVGPSLGNAERPDTELASGTELADFFDPRGLSRVAGRAVLLPAGRSLEQRVRNAVAAGASAVLVAGGDILPGSLDLDEGTAVSVVALPAEAGSDAAAALAGGTPVSVSFGDSRRVPNAAGGQVAAFSSGGMALGGNVKPDLVAPGVGIATADGGANADGSERYATATGSSVSAAIVAGSAALLKQARPGLTAGELRSLLVGSARQIVRDGVPDPVTVQGAGVVDLAAAAAAEVAAEPVTLAFGRVGGDGWQMTQTIRVRNLATRSLELGFGVARDRWGEPELVFSASPAHLSLRSGESADVVLVASGAGPLAGAAGGSFVVSPRGSRAIRLPWAVSFRSGRPQSLLGAVALSSRSFSASDAAPSVLAFRAGSVATAGDGASVEAVELLEAELWTAKGRRLGVLARLRDLLPGRYAFGITGRGPDGKRLAPGGYVIRLRAQPPTGDAGARATAVDVPFTIRP